MKKLLSAERAREALVYNQETGVFTWRLQPVCRPRLRPGQLAGMLNSDGYWRLKIDSVAHLAHRVAWLYVHGRWPTGFIDHINGIRSDNRLCNLREATRSENARNRSLRKDNSSGVVGVHFDRRNGKWIATGSVDGAHYVLGRFSAMQDAVAAREAFIAAHWGEFAPNVARRISDRIAPMTITTEGLRSLGFDEAREADFPAVVDSIVAHLRMAQSQQQVAA